MRTSLTQLAATPEESPMAQSPALAPQKAVRALNPRLYMGLALFCTMLWAAAQIGVKAGLSSAPPLWLMGLRFVAAAIILQPVILFVQSPWPADMGGFVRLVILGLVNNTLYLGLTGLGLASISAGLACVLTGMNPLALALGGWLFFNEDVRRRDIVGLMGALLGVIWVMASRLGENNRPEGVALIVLANIIMVVGNLLYKRWSQQSGLLVSHSMQLLSGGLVLIALAARIEGLDAVTFDTNFFLAEGFLVFGVSFGAMLTWLFLLAQGSASKAGAFLFLVPLFGLGQSAWVLGEKVSRTDFAGAMVTTLCVWWVQRPRPAPVAVKAA